MRVKGLADLGEEKDLKNHSKDQQKTQSLSHNKISTLTSLLHTGSTSCLHFSLQTTQLVLYKIQNPMFALYTFFFWGFIIPK